MLMNELIDRFEAECLDDLRERTRRDYDRNLRMVEPLR